MFAQPEAKAKAQQLMNTPETTDQAAAGAQRGQFAHQVAGALAPSDKTMKIFHKYTPAPVDGMGTPIRLFSALAISRWGLEALSDLCVHGHHSTQDYAYKIINTITISLHPDDVSRLESGLEESAEEYAANNAFPLPSNFLRDKGPYLAIMTGYALLMLVGILVVMKRKDVK